MMKLEENRTDAKRLLDRLVMWWNIKTCRHVFKGPDLIPRDETGNVTWKCSKCGFVWRGPYGLAAPGEIVGPWGTTKHVGDSDT